MESAAGILRSSSFWWGVLVLAAVVLAGLAAMALVRRWAEQTRAKTEPPQAQLEHYRRLRDEGELSQQEFERIAQMLLPKDQEAGTRNQETEIRRQESDDKNQEPNH